MAFKIRNKKYKSLQHFDFIFYFCNAYPSGIAHKHQINSGFTTIPTLAEAHPQGDKNPQVFTTHCNYLQNECNFEDL